jgi:Protein of unknown function (DUF3617)
MMAYSPSLNRLQTSLLTFSVFLTVSAGSLAATPSDWPSLGAGQIESRVKSGNSPRELVTTSCWTVQDLKDAEAQSQKHASNGLCQKPVFSKSGNTWVMQTDCKAKGQALAETTRIEVTKVSAAQLKSVMKVNNKQVSETTHTRLGACDGKKAASTTIDGIDIEAMIKNAQLKNGKSKP